MGDLETLIGREIYLNHVGFVDLPDFPNLREASEDAASASLYRCSVRPKLFKRTGLWPKAHGVAEFLCTLLNKKEYVLLTREEF